MNKRLKNIILSLLMIPAGVLMIGIGFTMKIGHSVNTIVFLSGFLVVISGGILFLYFVIKN